MGDPAAMPGSLSGAPYLLLDLRQAGAAAHSEIADWLTTLPCPVIGIGDPLGQAASELASACDVTLESEPEAATLIGNIQRWPLASTVLVQVLRSIQTLPLAAALAVESLAYGCLQQGAEFRGWLAARSPVAMPAAEPGPAVEIDRDGGEVRLILNRPLHHNAMSVEMRDALVEALRWIRMDDSVIRVRLSGRGRCFSTGGELAEFGTAPDPATAHRVRSIALPGRELALCRDRVSVEVHGACIGSGIEFPAFAADLQARSDAFFQLPELRYGLIPGAGGCVSISRRIGRQRTAWMALSGRRVSARQAKDWGLIDRLIG
ncbi:MAG: enoyl-CoA hydratase/isomerase family protein [Hydrocarboniphaga sp.]|nr:enoyl-CoA hydratase/isomerase family protein [Hydrocarboniphaga sp.]